MAVTRIQGGGRTLMPGLIDNHVHILVSTSTQEYLLDPTTTEEAVRPGHEEAEALLMRGFTAVRDLGGPMLKDWKAIDKGTLPGPRIYPTAPMISQTSGHGRHAPPHEKSRRWGGEISRGELMGVNYIADGRPEVLAATRENLRAGATQIKIVAAAAPPPCTTLST